MTLIYFLIVIGILVFVHEFGHFIMAKQAGVRVEKFSLGMGPKLIGYKKGDTEYLISALPLGGYVKMAGENPDEERTGAPDEFQSKSVWQRGKIGVAGSLMNILLAFIVMPFVFMIGVPVEGPVKIGYVEKGSPAEHAGFMAGDVIEKVNGRKVNDWTMVLTLLTVNAGTDVKVTVDRHGEKKMLTFRLPPASELKIETYGLERFPPPPAEIGKLKPGFPAEKAGLEVHDKIMAVDGKPVSHWGEFALLVRQSGGRKLKLAIERGGNLIEKEVAPVKEGGKYVIGVEVAVKPEMMHEVEIKKYGFLESVRLGFEKTVEAVDLTFITLKKLLTFSLSIKSIGGPVMIAQLSGKAAEAGLSTFLSMLAVISISLGILNMLPIPILDGGLLLFLAIEAIRKKPLTRRTMEISQSIGATILITLIAVVSYNDIMRMFFSK